MIKMKQTKQRKDIYLVLLCGSYKFVKNLKELLRNHYRAVTYSKFKAINKYSKEGKALRKVFNKYNMFNDRKQIYKGSVRK